MTFLQRLGIRSRMLLLVVLPAVLILAAVLAANFLRLRGVLLAFGEEILRDRVQAVAADIDRGTAEAVTATRVMALAAENGLLGRRLDSRRHRSELGPVGAARAQNAYGVPAAREMSRAMVYGNKKLVVLYTASNALRLLASSQSLRLRAPAPRAEGRSQSAINHRRAAQVVCSSSGGIRVVEQPAAERWQIELNCIHMGTQLCRGTAGRFT